MSWMFLAVAICFEIAATSFIGTTQGFTRPVPTVLVLLGYGASFTMLAQAVKGLEIGTAYAIWSAVGTAAIAIIGMLFLGENASWPKFVGLGLVIAGVIVLNLSSVSHGGGHGGAASEAAAPSGPSIVAEA
ncbi:multidrug efflux SMR transporter [Microbacterium esteraromaticum]|uniref:DMT family transporter n=1 Tax=Microbacterium esteraromaticum TaxID=57043 RepID=UPI002367682C|nr:multidrug efflux SMR transporter [Microbacterium esteraromaticum]WDH78999.1 multidrug efflux SMR transporter [Microbacterium esteraromaticum]